MPTQRPVLNVALDQETYEALQDYCDREGVTAAALVEAFARAVTSLDQRLKPPSLPRLTSDARAIAGERRRRR